MLEPGQHKEWNEGNDIGCVHGVDVSRTESTHTVVMVERRVDAVYTDGVHAELLEERDVTLASGAILERVDESRRLGERIVWIRRSSTYASRSPSQYSEEDCEHSQKTTDLAPGTQRP